jgi:lipoyl-dependent peroxiredoxin
MTTRNGHAEWHGSAESGSGTITVGDGVFEGAYSYESRFGEAAGTNPEQLLAAAHSGCFTMALANGLSVAGRPPQSLRSALAGIPEVTLSAKLLTADPVDVPARSDR